MKSLVILLIALLSTSVFANEKKCFGTEPFWGLKIDTESVLLTDYSTDKPVSSKILSRQVSTGSAGDVLEIIKTDKMTIVTRKVLCNDGMSDREYDFEVVVSDNDSQLEIFSGCCK